jgi:hypothetical protein
MPRDKIYGGAGQRWGRGKIESTQDDDAADEEEEERLDATRAKPGERACQSTSRREREREERTRSDAGQWASFPRVEDIEKPPGIDNFGPSPLFATLAVLLDEFAHSQPKGSKLKDKYGMLSRWYDVSTQDWGEKQEKQLLLVPARSADH